MFDNLKQKSDAKYDEDVVNKRYFERKLKDAIDAIDVSENWISPTLINDWINYGQTFETAGYYKKGDRVYIKGLIKGGATGTDAFVLPEGYRPPETIIVPIQTSAGNGRVYIYTTGRMNISIGHTTWTSLGGISFRI